MRKYTILGMVVLFTAWSARSARAHEPLFMMSHEAPGKGASDWHVAIHGERGEDEDETEFEVEYTRGITRDLAFKVGVPLVRREERSEPYRDSRRLQTLRGWRHEQANKIFPASAGACGADGVRASGGAHIAVGHDQFDFRQDWLYARDIA